MKNSSDDNVWYCDKGVVFSGNEPWFFDPSEFPWVSLVEDNWEIFRDELKAHIASDNDKLEPYIDQDLVSKKNKWKTLGMMFWTLKSESNAKLFPKTWNVLKGVPGLSAISFNSLAPNTTIKPHIGNTNAIMRCHVGLVVPDTAPKVGFRVGKEVRSWEEGKILMFCDAHEHTAWNNSDEERFILVIDVFQDQYIKQSRAVSSRVLAGIYYEAALKDSKFLSSLGTSKFGNSVLFGLYRLYYWLSLQGSSVNQPS